MVRAAAPNGDERLVPATIRIASEGEGSRDDTSHIVLGHGACRVDSASNLGNDPVIIKL